MDFQYRLVVAPPVGVRLVDGCTRHVAREVGGVTADRETNMKLTSREEETEPTHWL